ncbi:hypothetical protein [Paraburkholderia pallida]|uniref:Uncharacterized protein n=1 Tax=Paraburkholderia pallida TaxID=2547399 RepID=A0A4P7D4I4_9BURK|nr:hypothetical protein [Paraburkholderia pallida]QBR03701.1 hypothetical protein E1956_42120 [Paraburkholderia pallida]
MSQWSPFARRQYCPHRERYAEERHPLENGRAKARVSFFEGGSTAPQICCTNARYPDFGMTGGVNPSAQSLGDLERRHALAYIGVEQRSNAEWSVVRHESNLEYKLELKPAVTVPEKEY